MATRDARRPIVMFTNDNNTANARAAVAAGVSAYIVAALRPERIRPILDVAMARFEHEQALLAELADTKTEFGELSAELNDCKVIDRAKGLLMPRQQLSEEAAYARLRKTKSSVSLLLRLRARTEMIWKWNYIILPVFTTANDQVKPSDRMPFP